MARHVETADALFDSNNDFSPLEPRTIFLDPSILESTHTLSSKALCFFTVNHMHNMLIKSIGLNFKALMSSFLDMTQGHRISRNLKRMPTLDCMEVEIYQALTIDDFDTSGKPISDKIMAHDQYFR
nr:hypothetical protein [Mammaliicoccus vitulinus]